MTGGFSQSHVALGCFGGRDVAARETLDWMTQHIYRVFTVSLTRSEDDRIYLGIRVGELRITS